MYLYLFLTLCISFHISSFKCFPLFISIPLCLFYLLFLHLSLHCCLLFTLFLLFCEFNIFTSFAFSRSLTLSNQSHSHISFPPSFPLSQFPHWSSRLIFPRLPSANWCTSPAWWRPETCPYASRGARMARRSCLPRASPSTRRSSWAPSRYPRCHSSTMATTPASPATMLPLSARRGNSQWLVSPE